MFRAKVAHINKIENGYIIEHNAAGSTSKTDTIFAAKSFAEALMHLRDTFGEPRQAAFEANTSERRAQPLLSPEQIKEVSRPFIASLHDVTNDRDTLRTKVAALENKVAALEKLLEQAQNALARRGQRARKKR